MGVRLHPAADDGHREATPRPEGPGALPPAPRPGRVLPQVPHPRARGRGGHEAQEPAHAGPQERRDKAVDIQAPGALPQQEGGSGGGVFGASRDIPALQGAHAESRNRPHDARRVHRRDGHRETGFRRHAPEGRRDSRGAGALAAVSPRRGGAAHGALLPGADKSQGGVPDPRGPQADRHYLHEQRPPGVLRLAQAALHPVQVHHGRVQELPERPGQPGTRPAVFPLQPAARAGRAAGVQDVQQPRAAHEAVQGHHTARNQRSPHSSGVFTITS